MKTFIAYLRRSYTAMASVNIALAKELQRTIHRPSPSLALILGIVTLVLANLLFNDLTSIPQDEHFWLLDGVLAAKPLALALGGYLLLLWAAWMQLAVISAKTLGKVRL